MLLASDRLAIDLGDRALQGCAVAGHGNQAGAALRASGSRVQDIAPAPRLLQCQLRSAAHVALPRRQPHHVLERHQKRDEAQQKFKVSSQLRNRIGVPTQMRIRTFTFSMQGCGPIFI